MIRQVNIVPGTSWRPLVRGIQWGFYQHWGTGYLAGEGILQLEGDGSGGIRIYPDHPYPLTTPPRIAQARLYRSARGEISALLEYPDQISRSYRWEIYQRVGDGMDGVEFFDAEEAMEARVVEVIGEVVADPSTLIW